MKPIFSIIITSLNNTSSEVKAVFDSGSYYTIIRSDKLPENTRIIEQSLSFGTANKKGKTKIKVEHDMRDPEINEVA